MTESEPTAELNEQFSSPGATARPWSEVAEVLSGLRQLAALWPDPRRS
jgi:hypothetical protein